jgi:3-hydroxyacyl-[acyl-carrier-protein] dehydratase
MNADKILEYLPENLPFLLIDRVLSVTPGKSAHVVKNISHSDMFIKGTGDDAFFPSTLMLELAVQAGYLCLYSAENPRVTWAYLDGFDKTRFFDKALPGDVLEFIVEFEPLTLSLARGKAEGFVEGYKVCETEITYSMSIE